MSTKEPAEDVAGLLAEIEHLRTELATREAEITRLNALVDQDMLLPILNRRAFERELARSWSSAERYGFQIALIYIDLDGMKAVNDRFGHDIGDHALKAVAEVLISNSRESDTVGRLGGDEFALIMMQASEDEGQKKAALLSETISVKQIQTIGAPISVTTSFGVCGSQDVESYAAMMKRADERMYRMKIAKTEQ